MNGLECVHFPPTFNWKCNRSENLSHYTSRQGMNGRKAACFLSTTGRKQHALHTLAFKIVQLDFLLVKKQVALFCLASTRRITTKLAGIKKLQHAWSSGVLVQSSLRRLSPEWVNEHSLLMSFRKQSAYELWKEAISFWGLTHVYVVSSLREATTSPMQQCAQ